MVRPVGLNVFASQIAAGARMRGWRILGAAGAGMRKWRILGAGLLLALAGLVGSNAWVAWRSRGHAYDDAATVPSRSIAIVPGSRVFEGKPLHIVRSRLQAALDLYRAGRVKAILVSGDDSAASPEVTVMGAWLRAHGVPAGDVWSDGGGSRTRETMNRAAALFGVTDAVVCTQTVNMDRSLYLARAAGIDAVGLALPTNLGHSKRYLATESLKTTLAFAESTLREGPARPAPLLASR
jgi:vancomycin permeability regulator SanA